jgi:ferrochelatase
MRGYDALLVVSFGGPEGPDDVMPFLRNVVRGRNVPEERLQLVAERYQRFGGVSPINGQTRALVDAIRAEIPELPVYWGNRNWHPFLADTLAAMTDAGVERALAFATSAYSSYSSCRQYLEDIESARAKVGEGAPRVDKLPPFCDQDGFVEANRERLHAALTELGANEPTVMFTAHSLPESMASQCDYAAELERTAVRVLDRPLESRLVYQSRSGPPSMPWLGPDVLDALREAHTSGVTDVVIAPIGFVCDHMEVVFDLDVEAKDLADELGMHLVRAKTVGTHPRFVRMIRELVAEAPVECDAGCCPAPRHEHPRS